MLEAARWAEAEHTRHMQFSDGERLCGTRGEINVGLYLGFKGGDADPGHAAWLADDSYDWLPATWIARCAYRRYTGAAGVPSASFRVSFHRAVRTLADKGFLELRNKAPKTREGARRRVDSLLAVRPTLAGFLAINDEAITGEYEWEAFPVEPGVNETIRVSRVYWRGLNDPQGGWPEAVHYTYASDFVRNARREKRWVPLKWSEWWQLREGGAPDHGRRQIEFLHERRRSSKEASR